MMRNRILSVLVLSLAGCLSRIDAAALDTLAGTVCDSATNAPLDSVMVRSEGDSAMTNANGVFKLVIPGTAVARTAHWTISFDPVRHAFSWQTNQGFAGLEIRNLKGGLVAAAQTGSQAGVFSIAHLPQGVYLALVRTVSSLDVYKIMKLRIGAGDVSRLLSRASGPGRFAISLASSLAHVVVFSKAGYAQDTVTVPANSPSSTAMSVKLVKKSRYIVLFDGTSLDNWVVDPASCSIKDSAIYISGCSKCMMWSKGDYDNFRLLFTCRETSASYAGNTSHEHMGIGVWGARRTDFLEDNVVQFTAQNCWIYDFVTGGTPAYTGGCEQPNAGGTAGWDSWSTVEFLFNMTDKSVKSAVNGLKMDNYKFTGLNHLVKGPFGLQKYGSIPVEYKDIKVELDPLDTNLVTVKP